MSEEGNHQPTESLRKYAQIMSIAFFTHGTQQPCFPGRVSARTMCENTWSHPNPVVVFSICFRRLILPYLCLSARMSSEHVRTADEYRAHATAEAASGAEVTCPSHRISNLYCIA
jgi:hypothetical protein